MDGTHPAGAGRLADLLLRSMEPRELPDVALRTCLEELGGTPDAVLDDPALLTLSALSALSALFPPVIRPERVATAALKATDATHSASRSRHEVPLPT